MRVLQSALSATAILSAVAACSNSSERDDASERQAVAREPLYSQHDGDVYMYVGTLTADEKKQGADAPVVNIRFLGNDGAAYRLEQVDDSGAQLATYECSAPCRVAKQILPGGEVKKLAVAERSIVGSAFLDAFAGDLTPTTAKASARQSTTDAVEERVDLQAVTTPSPSGVVARAMKPPLLSGRWAMYRTRIAEGHGTAANSTRSATGTSRP